MLLRPPTPEDAPACGRICYEAFKGIAEAHGFTIDFPSPEAATSLLAWMIEHPRFFGVVAEEDGRVIGSNFVDERNPVAGIGPITVDPASQSAGTGRALMEGVLDRVDEAGFAGVRLVQSTYNTRSLSLYTKLGFETRETCAVLRGAPVGVRIAGYEVRPAADGDLAACNALCRAVHGHDRPGELADAIGQGAAQVVEHDGRISGYTTGIGFLGHAVGETNEDVKALIGAATGFAGPGLILPMRNGELFRWCLDRGLRVGFVMTLMSVGLYNEPAGAFLPSVLY